jgi:predicted transcriptional regulator
MVYDGITPLGLLLSPQFLLLAILTIFIPLLIRIEQKDLLDNDVRSMVRTYIRLHPGAHYSAIKSGLGLPNGTLIYHLNIMEKNGLIYSQRDGRFKRFYPSGVKPATRPILTKFQEDILATIKETPGISKAELAYIFERDRQDINHNINVLMEKELIKIHKQCGRVFLHINDGEMDNT